MNSIGIICEFNPLHNGHIHFITEIRKKYPDEVLILILNGYFLQRGEVSFISKEAKTKLSLEYGLDIVLELPVIYGVQSADLFAEKSLEILNHFKINKIIFGSEKNDVSILKNLANKTLFDEEFNKDLKVNLKKGFSFPKASSLAFNEDRSFFTPNDILGISYIKAILKNKYKIKYETIKRTNDYHDLISNEKIISATNIRGKIKENKNIEAFVPMNVIKNITPPNDEIFFNILKYTLSIVNLENILTNTEGLINRVKKAAVSSYNYNDLLEKTKTKRYTKTRIQRFLIHSLLNINKDISFDLVYIKILGINKRGKKYLNEIKKDLTISTKIDKSSIIYNYEIKAAILYDILTENKENAYKYELNNKTILK